MSPRSSSRPCAGLSRTRRGCTIARSRASFGWRSARSSSLISSPVALATHPDEFYVEPEWWLENAVHERNIRYLAQHGGTRPVTPDSTHGLLVDSVLADWKDRRAGDLPQEGGDLRIANANRVGSDLTIERRRSSPHSPGHQSPTGRYPVRGNFARTRKFGAARASFTSERFGSGGRRLAAPADRPGPPAPISRRQKTTTGRAIPPRRAIAMGGGASSLRGKWGTLAPHSGHRSAVRTPFADRRDG
jgi:hypothetical protein